MAWLRPFALAATFGLAGCIPPPVVSSGEAERGTGTRIVLASAADRVMTEAERSAFVAAIGPQGKGSKIYASPAFVFRPRSVGAYTGDGAPPVSESRWTALPETLRLLELNRWEAVWTLSLVPEGETSGKTLRSAVLARGDDREGARAAAFAGLLRQLKR